MNLYLMAFQLMLFAQRQFGGRPGGGAFGQPQGGNPFGPGGAPGGNVEPPIGLILTIYLVVFLIVGIPSAIGMWKTFTKAGQPGWPGIFFFLPPVPCYFMGEISGKGGGYGVMVGIGLCLPCVNLIALIFYILLLIEFCKAYDQGAGMAIGLWLLAPVFWPILGFGSAEYVGTGGRRGGRSRRRRDYDDDDDDDRPRRRGRDDDDDDDRPRRSRRDDDDDNPPRRPRRGDDEGDDRVRKRRPDDY